MSSPSEHDVEKAELLKERVYVTFTSLVLVLALRSHAEDITAAYSAATVLIGVLGTLTAVFLADIMAYLEVYSAFPARARFAHMLRVSFGSIGVIVVPLLLIGVSALGLFPLRTALTAGTIVLLATLFVVGFVAIRRVKISFWQRLLVLLAEVVLGSLVVILELLIHG